MNISAKKAAIWSGWGISLLFLAWAMAKIDFHKVWDALLLADLRWIIPAVALNLLVLAVRAARWRVFIEPVKPVEFMPVFAAMAIGYMANMILPARIGEVARAMVLAEQEKIPKGTAFGTVVVERVFDGLSAGVLMALVFMLITPLPGAEEKFGHVKAAGLTASAAFILAFLLVYSFHKRIKPVVWMIDKSTRILPGDWGGKLRDALESLRLGLDSIDHGHRVAKIALWSVPVWGLAGPFNYFFFLAFDLNLPWESGFLVLVTQMFGLMAPSAPGFIGVYHAATMAGLMLYGVDAEKALSVAVVMHLVVFVAQTLPGFYFMWKMSYSLGEIKEREEKTEKEIAGE